MNYIGSSAFIRLFMVCQYGGESYWFCALLSQPQWKNGKRFECIGFSLLFLVQQGVPKNDDGQPILLREGRECLQFSNPTKNKFFSKNLNIKFIGRNFWAC
jgi:hypothetical protein